MEITVEAIKKIVPFNLLPDGVIEPLLENFILIKYTHTEILYEQGISKLKGVDLIFEGNYQTFFSDHHHEKFGVENYTSGTCYGGVSVLLNRKRSLKTVEVKKGTIVLNLHRKYFKELCKINDQFYHHFISEFGKRMMDEEFEHFFKKPTHFDESFIASDQLYSKKINAISLSAIVYCDEDLPIYKAAKIMAQSKVSCLFVKNAQHQIIGYITDIILRDKIVAKQADSGLAISTIINTQLIKISATAFVYEALLMMFQTHSKYVLVEENGEFSGYLNRNKLLSEQAQSPLLFIQSVRQANSIQELKAKWKQVPQKIFQLLDKGVNAEIANQVITTIADSITQKIIEKVKTEMGEPPAKFVFMVTGSEGRKELTLKTDQDNAIIYEDKGNEQRELVRNYFLAFADKISTYLNAIGFEYCSGGFMAKNPTWTHSLSHWKNNYKSWMDDSLPETVIKFSTFFDCRLVYGERQIMHELRDFLDIELQKPLEKFYVNIAKNALQYEPPLTFFNNIRTKTIGEQEVFDIKKAMTPVVDLVRVYALQHRLFEENTGERLKALLRLRVFNETQYLNLTQCYYFLMSMRLKHQALQIIQEKLEPDNLINIKQLSKIEIATLKEIFKTIADFQAGIKLKFTNNLLG